MAAPSAPLTRPSSSGDKPRVRIKDGKIYTADGIENFLTRTGITANNLSAASTYNFLPISRNRLQVEWAYRSSWIVGTIVDCVAEDMTVNGVDLLCDASPDEISEVESEIDSLQVWSALCDTEKWSRLYGGAIGLLMINDQDVSTPLDIETVNKDQFRGVLPLDR